MGLKEIFRSSYMSLVDSVATKNANTDNGPEGHPDAMDRAAWVARAAESESAAGVSIGAGGTTPRSPSYSDATGAAPPPAPSA